MLHEIDDYPSMTKWFFIGIWLRHQENTSIGKISDLIMQHEFNPSMMNAMISCLSSNKSGMNNDQFSVFILRFDASIDCLIEFCQSRTKCLPPQNIDHWHQLTNMIKIKELSLYNLSQEIINPINLTAYLEAWEAAGFPANWEGPKKELSA